MPPDPHRSSALRASLLPLRGNYISHSIQTKNLGIYAHRSLILCLLTAYCREQSCDGLHIASHPILVGVGGWWRVKLPRASCSWNKYKLLLWGPLVYFKYLYILLECWVKNWWVCWSLSRNEMDSFQYGTQSKQLRNNCCWGIPRKEPHLWHFLCLGRLSTNHNL